jgi:hypothetical protein
MKAIWLRSARVALAVLSVGAVLVMPAPAQAKLALMKLSSHVFPSGAVLPGGVSGSALVVGSSVVKLTAPQYVYEPPVAPASSGTVYQFMFWDVAKGLITTAKASFAAPNGTRFAATAWYVPICVASCTGGGLTFVTTWAFSLTSYKVLPVTPIASVSPSSAWTSPSKSVSTASAATISAKQYLGFHSSFAGTAFGSWFVFGGSGITVSGLDLGVPAGESPYAIAFYFHYTGPPPKPGCVSPKCY